MMRLCVSVLLLLLWCGIGSAQQLSTPPGASGGACSNCMVTDAANLINAIAAPGTPAASKGNVWLDSTSKTLKVKDDAGADSTTVRADTGASNNFLTAISASGVISKAQPSSSNLSDAATLAKLTANTFTATQTINPANDTAMLTSSGSSVTGSSAGSMIDLARTWNTTGAPTAIKLAITDTASNANSNLMDLLGGAGGATSMFKVRRDGQVTTAGPVLVSAGDNNSPSLGWSADADGTGTGFYRPAADQIGFSMNGINRLSLTASAATFQYSVLLSGGGSRFGISGDTFLNRDVAAAFQMGDDAATPIAQTFKAHDGLGADKDGADFTIAGGNGTGTGLGGAVVFATTPAGSTGSTQNTSVSRARFMPNGHFRLAELSADPSAADLTSGANAKDRLGFYMKGDKIVFSYNNAGTVTYVSLPLDGSTTTWTHSTAAP